LEAEPCAACKESAFPEASAALDALGFPPDQYRLLLAWTETAPANRALSILGYHVEETETGYLFDVYTDSQGRLLDELQISELGVRAKNWVLRATETLSELSQNKRAVCRPPLMSRGIQMGLAATQTIELPSLDLESIEREDIKARTTGPKSAMRIGVFQPLPQPIEMSDAQSSHGTWMPVPGGQILSVSIQSPQAQGLRIHFAEFQIPQGGQATIYNAANPSEVYDVPSVDTADVWSPTCFSEIVVIEIFVPENAHGLRVVVDQIAHIYRGFSQLPWGKDAGSCNLDVSCYPEWAATARGVGGIGTIGASGVLWCTGALVVDTDPATQIPYFLTAHHCVGSQAKASTIEVYWLYQTAQCDDSAPDPASVPRTTGGADFLAGSGGSGTTGGGNDFALLRLRQAVPDDLTYIGWSTVAPPVGTPVTVVHHPSGDFKRISFGALTDNLNPHNDLYHEAMYSAGTTEPGSSGSPLMKSATQQIIGQLWGGAASCLHPELSDYYGRFDVTFPLVRGFLDTASVPAVVDFSMDAYAVNEAQTDAVITVVLDRPPAETVSVDYMTTAQTAVPGVDYEDRSGTLVFESTQQSKTFLVPVYANLDITEDRTVALTLLNAVGCELGTGNNPALLTIRDMSLFEMDAVTVPFFEETDRQNFVTMPIKLRAQIAEPAIRATPEGKTGSLRNGLFGFFQSSQGFGDGRNNFRQSPFSVGFSDIDSRR